MHGGRRKRRAIAGWGRQVGSIFLGRRGLRKVSELSTIVARRSCGARQAQLWAQASAIMRCKCDVTVKAANACETGAYVQ